MQNNYPLNSSECPVCHTTLGTATHVASSPDASEEITFTGNPTICGACAALLIFADENGGMRVPTAEENARFQYDPVIQKVREAAQAMILATRLLKHQIN